MHGIERAEIEELKQINLKEYLFQYDRASYRVRNNGTMVKKDKSHIVIYDDHSYQFNTTTKAYKDNIGTLQILYGWGFMEAVNHLRDYRDKKEIPKFNLFDWWNVLGNVVKWNQLNKLEVYGGYNGKKKST